MDGDIYLDGERFKRDEFKLRARRVAQDLMARGVKPDDVIAVLMRNDVSYLMMAETARLVGVRYAAINWHSTPSEVEHILRDSGAKVFYAHIDLLAPVQSIVPGSVTMISVPVPDAICRDYTVGNVEAPGAVDIAGFWDDGPIYEGAPQKNRGLFAYTSGSTGTPKGIKRVFNPDGPDSWQTFAGLARNLMNAHAGDRMYISAPLYHSAPNTLANFVMAAGDVDLYIDPKFDPEKFLQTVDRHKITHAYIVPTMMVRMLKLSQSVRDRYDISSLRFTISTGSPWPSDVKNAMIEWFGPIMNESYGASEIGFMTLISSEEAMAKPGSVGKVLPGGAVKVLDDDFNELPPGKVGTLYISLPIFGDYEYSNSDGSMTGQKQGSFSTVGDMGHVDDDGYIFISDRKKDMIITGGANVFPAEIEAQLILMPEIADCAVFGAPDPEFGEKIVAAVTCLPGKSVTLADVRAFLEPNIAKFKLPRIVDLHDELPRQDSGKIYKAKLRAPYWDGRDKLV